MAPWSVEWVESDGEADGVVNTLIKVAVNGCTAVGAKMGRGEILVGVLGE